MEKIGAIAGLAPSMWPDEIIEIIVAQVPSSSIGDDQLKALKNCALVSKSFYFPARKRLFATVEFNVDDSAQARAARLCQALKTNPAIIHEIKSFKLLLKSSVAAKVFSSKGPLEKPKLLRIFWRESSFYRLLTWISHAKLQTFAIYSNPHPFNMSNMSISSKSLFLAIRSIPSLRSLSIVGVINVPGSLVMGSIGHDHLRHLLLCGSTLQESSDAPIPGHDSDFNLLSKVEVLEWCCMPYFDLSHMRWLAPAYPLTFEAVFPFPHLRRYTATLHKNAEANAMIWNVILGAAHTLEDLDIRDVTTGGNYQSFIDLFSFERLTALRRLTLAPHCHCTTVFTNCQWKLHNVVELLSSATMPTTMESLILDFHIGMKSGVRIDLAFMAAILEWATLDALLTGPMFPNLRVLSFMFNSIYYDPQIDVSGILLAKERNALRLRALLEFVIPHIMVGSRISVDVDCTALSLSDMPTRCIYHCNTSHLYY